MAGFIPWSNVDLRLRGGRSIWLSSTRPDGRPHAVPVWYWWDGRRLYFVTPRRSQKARNLARQPWVIVHAGDGDDVIILEGPTAIVHDRDEVERINACYMQKYVDPHSGAQATMLNADDDVYRVNVQHVMAWSYGTIGTRTDWYFDA